MLIDFLISAKLGHFQVNFAQFWVIFWPFFPPFFRDLFFAKNFSSSHFSFFAKNDKLCNTSQCICHTFHTFKIEI